MPLLRPLRHEPFRPSWDYKAAHSLEKTGSRRLRRRLATPCAVTNLRTDHISAIGWQGKSVTRETVSGRNQPGGHKRPLE